MAQTPTLSRSQTVQNLIQRVFGVSCSHLSELQGRNVEEYCRDKGLPKYIANFFFRPEEKKVLNSGVSAENYSAHLGHKFLKTCCGLKPPKHEGWGSETENDTIEFLITYCWTGHKDLDEAPPVSDENVNSYMDKILEALISLVEKVEQIKDKNVDETSLKSELARHIGQETECYGDSVSSRHIYAVLCHHALHHMLVMVYLHLNHLHGMSLSKYLTNRRINLMPRTLFSNERKFLESNPHPREMPFSILYQVVKRVCFRFDKWKKNHNDNLEYTLYCLRKEYVTPLRMEEQYTVKCMTIFKLLDKAFEELCRRADNDRQHIIGLTTSTQIVSPPQISQSLECSPCSPKIPKISTSPSSPPAASPSTQSQTQNTSVQSSALKVEEINICVIFKVFCAGGIVSQTLGLVFEALDGSFKPLQGEGRKTFYPQEKDFLETLDENTGYSNLCQKDPSLLYKLLKHRCPLLSKNDDTWISDKGTLEYHITFIKKERNRLAHEMSDIKTNDLESKLKNIEDVLYRILERTASKLKDNKQAMKMRLKNYNDKVKSEMGEIFHIAKTLPHDMVDLRTMINKVKPAAQKELSQPGMYPENLLSLSPISGSSDERLKHLTVSKVFVERQLEDKDDIEAGTTYGIEEMLLNLNTTLDSYRAFIIHGRPGDGKTSICKYMFYLWSHNLQKFSQKGIYLFMYIPCRYVTTRSLSTYLKKKLPRTFADVSPDDIIPLLQELEVLFVIDGYDEAGEEAKSVADEIFTSLPESRVIFTTKTQWLPKLLDTVKSKTSHYKVLSMVEMTQEKIQQDYIRRIFDAMKVKDCDKFLRHLPEMREKLKTLIAVPLTLSLLSLLWIEEPENARKTKTLPQLYHKLIGLTLNRVTKQLGMNDSIDCQKWMITLGELAWYNLKKNKHFLSEDDQIPLKKRAQELGLGVEGNKHLISSLLHCDMSNLTLCEPSWRFALNSQQEYFAAEYIVDTLTKDKTIAIKSILQLENLEEDKYKKRLQRLVPVLEFICGLLVIRNGVTEARLKEIVEIMSVKEPWSFVAIEKMFRYFIDENEQMQLSVKNMFMGHNVDTLEGFEPQSTLWVMRNSSLGVQRDVIVDSPVSDLQQLKPLLDDMLLKSRNVTILVLVDKVTSISAVSQLIQQDQYNTVQVIFKAWDPRCISEVIMKWPHSRPLHLFLHPEFFALVWWEALMCLHTLNTTVAKLACNSDNGKLSQIVHSGADRLGTSLITDNSLLPTEVVIYFNS